MEKTNNTKLILNAMHGLKYDIDEVDNALYMFNHEASGCVMLSFSDNISKIGRVYLDGDETTDFKLIDINYEPNPVLAVKVRGKITKYDTKVPLKIEGFCDKSGREMSPCEFVITVLPRRNEKSEKYKYNDSVAYKAAAESVVMLKNNGALPFKKGSVVNLFGCGVSEYRSCAVGAGRINPRSCNSLLTAISESDDLSINVELAEFYKVPNDNIPSDEILKRAKALSNTAVMVITRGSGENIDNRPINSEFYLSDKEEDLIKKLTDTFAKTVVILNVGYPIDVRFLEKYNVSACLYVGFGGMYGGEAVADILVGKASPCGYLSDTFALDYYDSPSAHNFLNFTENEAALQTDSPFWATVCYEEGIYVGYRYFTSFNKKCAYPFGFGLSYTDFSKTVTKCAWNGQEISAVIKVKNIGKIAGKTAVQLYVSKPDAEIEQAAVELLDFEKTDLLKADTEQEIIFNIPAKRLKSFDSKNSAFVLLKGNYKIYLGENASDLKLINSFNVEKTAIIQRVEHYAACDLPFAEMGKGKPFAADNKTNYHKEPICFATRRELPLDENEKPKEKIMFSKACADIESALKFACQLSDYELCRLSVCSISNWNMSEKRVAGWTWGLEKYNLPTVALADGNNGVNIPKRNIGMPSSSMVACSFDKRLAYEIGCVIANEAKENGVGIILGPGMNIHRNLLNGRHPEYFSEDPLLSGVMAGYQTKGLQDNGVCGCIKHIAGNNCEAVRKRSNSVISERALREIYMRNFEYALEITPADTVMTGYNAINGCFCDEDPELLQGILCDEMGFDGFIMSDWNSYDTSDMIKMVKAGVSFITPGSDDDSRVAPLLNALNDGEITRYELERNVARLVSVIARRI